MILGFTGTRRGMTEQQIHTVIHWIEKFKPDSVVHGCCVGADEQFDKICRERGVPRLGLPGNQEHMVMRLAQLQPSRPQPAADSTAGFSPENLAADRIGLTLESPALNLIRNRKIVEMSQIVLSCPKEMSEPLATRAGGTWMATRLSQAMKKQLIIIYPSGEMWCSDDPEGFVREGDSRTVATQKRIDEAFNQTPATAVPDGRKKVPNRLAPETKKIT